MYWVCGYNYKSGVIVKGVNVLGWEVRQPAWRYREVGFGNL